MAGLVDVDPALACLPEALEEAALRGWALLDVQWTPGRRCQLAWRVPGAGGAGPTFRAGLVHVGGWSSHDYRADSSLPGLNAATDVSVVAPRLEQILGQPLTTCQIQPVRYRPGARCVLRYDVAGPGGEYAFYAKVFSRQHFADTASVVILVAESAAGTGMVAPVVAVWAELDTLVAPAVPGRSMSAFLGDPAVPADERRRSADRLGQLLADFHALDADPVPARSAAGQLDELQELRGCVTTIDPPLGKRYGALLGSLRAGAPPETEDPVLTHGGFRAGQVVLTPSGALTLLDLDGASRGDPARDLATAAAQMVWQAVRQPDQAELLRCAEEALTAGYHRNAPAVDPSRLQWWRAAAILQVAGRRYRRLELADRELIPALLDQARIPSADPRSNAKHPVDGGLMDLHRMTTILAPVLEPIAAVPTQIQVTSARELALAPGRRRVVRYAVAGLETHGPTDLVAKVFEDPRRAELLHWHLRVLSAGPFASGRWTVPQPLGYLPEHGLVLYRAASGVPMSALPDGAALVDGVLDAARWLATLHRSHVQLPRVLDRTQEIESTRQWAETLGSRDPSLRQPAMTLAMQWAAVGQPDPGTRKVPIHKDFHAGHVLVDSRICVVDLDEARLGDPTYDVAHFCTYLEWGSDRADSLCSAFLGEYARLTGWAKDGAFSSYSAYTWLKIAKQLATQAGPWRAAGADRGWTPAAALARGAAWLDL